jgi:hypothetical protein
MHWFPSGGENQMAKIGKNHQYCRNSYATCTNLHAPDAHFNNIYLFSDAQTEEFSNSKYYECKNPK